MKRPQKLMSLILALMMIMAYMPFVITAGAAGQTYSGDAVVDYSNKVMETYSITFNVTKREEKSATIGIRWVQKIKANYFDTYRYDVKLTCAGKSVTKTVVPANTWKSASSSARSRTTDMTLTIPVSTVNATTVTVSGTIYQYTSGGSLNGSDTGVPGKKSVKIPAYSAPVKTYTVSYNANGGSGAPASQTKTENVALTLSSTKPTRSGYTFKGWATSATATTAQYQAGASYTANAAVTLYAVWEKNPDKTYVVTYSANGGSGAPANQTKTEGVTLILSSTKPTRSGYTFQGWGTSASTSTVAYKPGASYTANSNLDLYAIWKKDAAKYDNSCRYQFSNSSNSFKTNWSKGKYYVSDSDFSKLSNYVKKYYSTSTANAVISELNDARNNAWSGSCYGMSVTSILDYYNKIAFNELHGNVATMHDVKTPNGNTTTDKNTMSAINYYHISQNISFIRKNYGKSTCSGLIDVANKNQPFLFCYWWQDGYYTYGHAIVGYSCSKDTSGNYIISAYDNRYPDGNVTIVVNSSKTSCSVKTPYETEKCNGIEYDGDMSVFDKIDIDGPNNNNIIEFSDYTYSNSNSTIKVVADGNVFVTNENGKTISIKDGNISSTMNIVSESFIVNSNSDGSPSKVTFIFEVTDTDDITIKSDSGTISASITTSDGYAGATAYGSDAVELSGNNGVLIEGENDGYTATVSSSSEAFNTLTLEGTSGNNISVKCNANGSIDANGVDGSKDSIRVYNDSNEEQEIYFRPGYSSISVVADNDGNIDIQSNQSDNEVPVSDSIGIKNYVETCTLDYKTTITFTANVSSDAGVMWIVNGAGYTLNEDGSCTVNKATNDFTICFKTSDENGCPVLSKTERVSVKHDLFNKIKAFFRGLFGKLPVMFQ